MVYMPQRHFQQVWSRDFYVTTCKNLFLLVFIWISHGKLTHYTVLILKILYCSAVFLRHHKLLKPESSFKQTRVIFYCETMTLFLNYATATPRALFAWRTSIIDTHKCTTNVSHVINTVHAKSVSWRCKRFTNKLKIRILSQTDIFYLIRHASVILIVGLHMSRRMSASENCSTKKVAQCGFEPATPDYRTFAFNQNDWNGTKQLENTGLRPDS